MAIDSDVERDSEGYLIDPTRWDEALAEALAEETGLSLGAGHWPNPALRARYWREHQVTPDVRHVVDFLVETQGSRKRRRRSTCFTSSPMAICSRAARSPGMQRPRAWSTG